jgi:glycerophosphoryl diester phosphodiesterase
MLLYAIIIIVIIIALYLLAVMPKLQHNPEVKKMDGWLYAHRGLHDNKSDAPENSLRAFALAVEKGYGIELDVQLTKDQVPIILHDYNLRRACHTDLEVSKLNYEELKGYRLFQSQETIPTLAQALEVIGGKVPVIIELKIPWRPEELCRKVSEQLKSYQGFYVIESFNPLGLLWYRKHYPKVVRGQLSTDFVREKIEGNRFQYFLLKHLLFNFLTKPDFIAYHHVYRSSLSFTLCRKLYRTKPVAWTIQSQEQLEQNDKHFNLFIFDSFIPNEKQ